MCTRIRNTITNDEAANPPELRRMLNVPELIKEEGYTTIADDCCLCQVDVKATVVAAGWKYHEVDGDYMDVQVTPPDGHSDQSLATAGARPQQTEQATTRRCQH